MGLMEMLGNRMRGQTKSLSNGNIHGYPGWIPAKHMRWKISNTHCTIQVTNGLLHTHRAWTANNPEYETRNFRLDISFSCNTGQLGNRGVLLGWGERAWCDVLTCRFRPLFAKFGSSTF